MNAATTASAPAKVTSWAWNITLVAIPLLTAAALLWLRHAQVQHLAARQIDNYGHVPDFRLTNQNGQPYGSEQLRGKIWIADFIYTTCPGPCPMISTRMSELQKPLRDTDVQLVSFSVDPEKDTPAVLRTYAETAKADPARWNFLTGPVATIYALSRDGFHLAALPEGDKPGQPVHSTRMVLVDRHEVIRGYYDATAADALTKLLADTSHLLREQPK
jgi:protein SCO1/2